MKSLAETRKMAYHINPAIYKIEDGKLIEYRKGLPSLELGDYTILDTAMDGTCQLIECRGEKYVILADNSIITHAELVSERETMLQNFAEWLYEEPQYTEWGRGKKDHSDMVKLFLNETKNEKSWD